MAYVISDECIGCGACPPSCPIEAITEKGGKYIIDANSCIDCGACLDSCPANAINPA